MGEAVRFHGHTGVEENSANLEGAAGVVLVDHCGLTVEQDTQLRKQMRAEGIIYKVWD